MKCEACKYKFDYDLKITKDNPTFITSDLKLTYIPGAWEHERIERILICPKCGTLKIEI